MTVRELRDRLIAECDAGNADAVVCVYFEHTLCKIAPFGPVFLEELSRGQLRKVLEIGPV